MTSYIPKPPNTPNELASFVINLTNHLLTGMAVRFGIKTDRLIILNDYNYKIQEHGGNGILNFTLNELLEMEMFVSDLLKEILNHPKFTKEDARLLRLKKEI